MSKSSKFSRAVPERYGAQAEVLKALSATEWRSPAHIRDLVLDNFRPESCIRTYLTHHEEGDNLPSLNVQHSAGALYLVRSCLYTLATQHIVESIQKSDEDGRLWRILPAKTATIRKAVVQLIRWRNRYAAVAREFPNVVDSINESVKKHCPRWVESEPK